MKDFEKKQWPVEHVPKDIICKNCKYRKSSIEVMGTFYERYTHADCEMYEQKPDKILWKKGDCPFYKKE